MSRRMTLRLPPQYSAQSTRVLAAKYCFALRLASSRKAVSRCLPSGRWRAAFLSGGGLPEGGGIVAQLLAEGFGPASGHAVQQAPEARAVVHLTCVAQFVEQHVVRQFPGEYHQVEREVDVALAGAAAPAGACRVDSYARVMETVRFGQFVQPCGEDAFGLFAQDFRDGLEEPWLQAAEVGLWRVDDFHVSRFSAHEEAAGLSACEFQAKLVCVDFKCFVNHLVRRVALLRRLPALHLVGRRGRGDVLLPVCPSLGEGLFISS